jgi:hypothetical protein
MKPHPGFRFFDNTRCVHFERGVRRSSFLAAALQCATTPSEARGPVELFVALAPFVNQWRGRPLAVTAQLAARFERDALPRL